MTLRSRVKKIESRRQGTHPPLVVFPRPGETDAEALARTTKGQEPPTGQIVIYMHGTFPDD